MTDNDDALHEKLVDLERADARGDLQGARTIDTGDTVKHLPTGEEWVVACVIGDRLSWCGWPEGAVSVSDCELVTKATPQQRDDLLREIASITGNDHRGRYARARLEKGNQL